jgi:hypothetical protein
VVSVKHGIIHTANPGIVSAEKGLVSASLGSSNLPNLTNSLGTADFKYTAALDGFSGSTTTGYVIRPFGSCSRYVALSKRYIRTKVNPIS